MKSLWKRAIDPETLLISLDDPCRTNSGAAAGGRIELVESRSHLRLSLRGTVIAESDHPLLLYEHGYPIRYYLSRQDVRGDLLIPSKRVTRCPYKGEASYYSVQTGDTIVEEFFWSYLHPHAAMSPIAGLLSFLPERADELLVDGRIVKR